MTGIPEPLSVASTLLRWLEGMGCREIFLVPGAQIDPITDALAKSSLRAVCAQHELGAAYMADASARIGRRIGVCLMGGGPGVSYAVAAAVTARVDRQPVVFISGAPAQDDGPAFQDVGAAGGRDHAVMSAALDLSIVVTAPEQLGDALGRAEAALSGPNPGPVHLCVPVDVQRATFSGNVLPRPASKIVAPSLDLQMIRPLLQQSRLLVLAGRGGVSEGVSDLLLRVLEKHHLPLVTTFDAKGILDETHPQCLGTIGYSATLRAKAAIAEMNGLIVLGAENQLRDYAGVLVDEPAGYTARQNYAPSAPAPCTLVASCRAVLEALIAEPGPDPDLITQRRHWLQTLDRTPRHTTAPVEAAVGGVDLPALVFALRDHVEKDQPVFCDAGLFRRFLGHYWTTYSPRTLLVAAQTAPMGWAIAGCVGAAVAEMSRPAFGVTGDGCMRMLGTEIATAALMGAPAKIIISDNGLLGNVYLRSRGSEAEFLSHSPRVDWVAFAEALGACGHSAETEAELRQALKRAAAEPGPSVIRVATIARDFDGHVHA